MITVLCPECQQTNNFDSELKIGKLVTCQLCNTNLVVVWLFPVCLDFPEAKEQAPNYQDTSIDGGLMGPDSLG